MHAHEARENAIQFIKSQEKTAPPIYSNIISRISDASKAGLFEVVTEEIPRNLVEEIKTSLEKLNYTVRVDKRTDVWTCGAFFPRDYKEATLFVGWK